MCFDAKTSAITFTIGALSSIYLFYNGIKTNNKANKLFSLVVILTSLMQLIEYFLWKNQKCKKTNHMFSLLIIVVLILQPILDCSYYYYLYKDKSIISLKLLLIYITIFSISGIFLINWLNKMQLCSTPSKKSCRLHWDPFTKLSKYKSIFLFMMLLYFIGPLWVGYDLTFFNNKLFKRYPIRFLFLPISLLLTGLYILIKKQSILKFSKTPVNTALEYFDTFGSLWCFWAVFLGLICILETISLRAISKYIN